MPEHFKQVWSHWNVLSNAHTYSQWAQKQPEGDGYSTNTLYSNCSVAGLIQTQPRQGKVQSKNTGRKSINKVSAFSPFFRVFQSFQSFQSVFLEKSCKYFMRIFQIFSYSVFSVFRLFFQFPNISFFPFCIAAYLNILLEQFWNNFGEYIILPWNVCQRKDILVLGGGIFGL